MIERLREGLHLQRRLTLISAAAGCGKTTLLSQWIEDCSLPVAWLSLEESDDEPVRFLAYVTAALQTIGVDIGEGVMNKLQASSPLPLPINSIVTAILNSIAAKPAPIMLVLDDYHVIRSKLINDTLAYLIEHMPPQMHLVIASRDNPDLPLARLRARNQVTEVRTTDLRFTYAEASEFIRQANGLDLSEEEVSILESRTEGWAVGLQLAALALQGRQHAADFISSFDGNHHYVLDYLVEEVLQQQPENIQEFLLGTSILDRMCGSLCEYVLGEGAGDSSTSAISGQEILEHLEQSNLFMVPLDKEGNWFRYHHLFSDVLRQRLFRKGRSANSGKREAYELHRRASAWFERHDEHQEAFQHAIAAQDVDRATRLIEGGGMPLIFRGAVAPVLQWLGSLPKEELETRPALYVMHASALLMVGQMTDIEHKLLAAETKLQGVQDPNARDLLGHIFSIRATLAVSKHQPDIIMEESRRALEHLSPDNLPVRTATVWTLGYAYQLKGERAAASKAYHEALAVSQQIGHIMITIMATLGLGIVQERNNQLHMASATYRRVLDLAGDPPVPAACEAHLGLARICYEWNDLKGAELHGQKALQLAGQFDQTDRVVACEVFLAKLELIRGALGEAVARLAQAEYFARQHNYVNQLSSIAEAQVIAMLQQGDLCVATQLANQHKLPLSQARVFLAQGDTTGALAILEPLRVHMEEKEWADERLKVMVMLALTFQARGEELRASRLIAEVVAMGEPSGVIRLFIDEGQPMQALLRAAYASKPNHSYLDLLLHAFKTEGRGQQLEGGSSSLPTSPNSIQQAAYLIESLTRRELEILHLISQGLSNRQISEKLYVALSTVKGHNRIIYDKLQATRRTEAVMRARELGLL
ncbi:LuxR C-terminal-related transcriptional regulator [Paenibacillus solani]|uniref:LuxR C-terminal-related transcriptional regulator n=1 Tax=Paenibacillus solani TaxID=1705565 RepID=UPI0030FF2EDB